MLCSSLSSSDRGLADELHVTQAPSRAYSYWKSFKSIAAGSIAAPRTVEACLQDVVVHVQRYRQP